MRSSLASLVVDSFIVHEVPKKSAQAILRKNPDFFDEDIILSEVPTEFNDDLVKFFHDRISSTIGSASAFDIEFCQELTDNQTRVAIQQYFDIGRKSGFPLSDDDVIRITQDIAKTLHKVQNAKNPGGILSFFPCHNNIQNGLAILKVEREVGVRIRREKNQQGKVTFNAEHIRDLMLTGKTKLFKVVLFYEQDDRVVGVVSDQQQGAYSKDVADFFLMDFLGCQLREESKVSTRNFYDLVNSFINSEPLTDKERLTLRAHLVSEISNNQPNLNVVSFAKRCVPVNHLQSFMDLVHEEKISTNFIKDCVLIEEKIQKVKYEFECGIKLSGSEENMRKNIKVEETIDGKTKYEIVDRLKRID